MLAALNTSDPDLVTDLVEDSALLINTDCWRGKAVAALTLLILHFGTRTAASMSSSGSAAAGPVTAKALDKMSVSYAAPTLTDQDAEWASTPWGSQYLALRRTLIIPPIVGRTC